MAEILHTPLTVLHVLACLFLMLIVLIQPGKGGGLGALSGAGAQQVFGGRGAGNILTKITWSTAAVFFVTSITLAYLSSSSDESLQRRAAAAKATEKLPPPPETAEPKPAIPAPEPAPSK
jgi:preprotein translocase subunit SecG